MGFYANTDALPVYELDEATRDRLIAHARQDAAHAVINASTLMDEVQGLKTMVYIISVIQTLLLGFIIWRLW